MTDAEGRELKVKSKQEVASPAEETKPGPVFTPDVDIFENDTGITLLADMPGVTSEDLEIDLRENVLTLAGDVKPYTGEDEHVIDLEYGVGRFYRQFNLSEVIDQARIEADLRDGVLRLSLPKVEKATPRKIEVRTA